MTKAHTNGFRWLPSYYEAIRELPEEERLMMYDAILDFGFGNPTAELPPLLAGYFHLITPTLAKSIRFEEKQKENGDQGGRPTGDESRTKPNGEADKTQTKPKRNPNKTQTKAKAEQDKTQVKAKAEQDETQTKANENLDIDVDVDVDVDNDVALDNALDHALEARAAPDGADRPRRARFTPPTREEVRSYCRKRGSAVDADRFFDYFETGAWVDAKGQPVRNWKQKLLTWENREKPAEAKQETPRPPDLSWREERSVTLKDLVEYPPLSGEYRPYWEVPNDA